MHKFYKNFKNRNVFGHRLFTFHGIMTPIYKREIVIIGLRI